MKEFQDIMQQLNEKHHKKDCDKMEWWSGRVELDLRLQVSASDYNISRNEWNVKKVPSNGLHVKGVRIQF